jgi:hypothetical protein
MVKRRCYGVLRLYSGRSSDLPIGNRKQKPSNPLVIDKPFRKFGRLDNLIMWDCFANR